VLPNTQDLAGVWGAPAARLRKASEESKESWCCGFRVAAAKSQLAEQLAENLLGDLGPVSPAPLPNLKDKSILTGAT
jgi:hypothetical protein